MKPLDVPSMCQTLLAVSACALMGACGTPMHSLQPGEPLDDVRQRLGPPTAQYPLEGKGQRLEYATGPNGRVTHMLDFDTQHRLQRWENVLNEARFNRIPAGTTRDQLRRELGTPSRVWAVHYRNQTVWSYRYEAPHCRLFHVGISPAGVVEDTSYGPDPMCEYNERFMGIGPY